MKRIVLIIVVLLSTFFIFAENSDSSSLKFSEEQLNEFIKKSIELNNLNDDGALSDNQFLLIAINEIYIPTAARPEEKNISEVISRITQNEKELAVMIMMHQSKEDSFSNDDSVEQPPIHSGDSEKKFFTKEFSGIAFVFILIVVSVLIGQFKKTES